MSATSQRISPKLYQERTAAIAAQADALRLVAVAVDGIGMNKLSPIDEPGAIEAIAILLRDLVASQPMNDLGTLLQSKVEEL